MAYSESKKAKEETAKGKGELNRLKNLVNINNNSCKILKLKVEYNNKDEGIKKDRTKLTAIKKVEESIGETIKIDNINKRYETGYKVKKNIACFDSFRKVEVKNKEAWKVKINENKAFTHDQKIAKTKDTNISDREEFKFDNLLELNKEVIQNIRYPEVVMPEIGNKSMDATNMDNEIVDHLFDPGRKCLSKHSEIVSSADLAPGIG
ncbi:9866_t:CDS:2, partial [Gigaspora margarita]